MTSVRNTFTGIFLKSCILILILPGIFSINIQAQTISGYISDSGSGERLLYAGIIDLQSGKATTSNSYGFFSLTPPAGSSKVAITVSYVGYLSDTLILNHLQRDTVLHLRLKAGLELKEVEIKATAGTGINSTAGLMRLNAKVIKALPALGGETDLIKAYQLTPGVQQGHEGTSGLHVRGGSPDQNLIMLDDVPLYNINHLGGFVSAFNTDAVKNSTLIKGGFQARYGGRLSSVLDVSMADGNLNKTTGNLSLGLISARVSLNGPIQKNKSTYLVSFRRFYFDLIAKPLAQRANPGSTVGYNFYDLNIKLSRIINTNNKVYLSFYNGDDKTLAGFKEKKDDGTDYYMQINRWGNTMAALRWNHLFSSRLFSNTTLHFTRYRVNNHLESETNSGNNKYLAENNLFSGIGELSLKPETEYHINPEMRIYSGIQLTYRYFKPNNYTYDVSDGDQQLQPGHNHQMLIQAFEGNIYTGAVINRPAGHTFEFGGRINTFFVKNHVYFIPEPRIKAGFKHNNNLSSFISFDLMSQNMHITGNNSIGMPVDYLLPATQKLPPSLMKQLSAGLEYRSGNGMIYTSELYYKHFSRLAMLKDGASLWEGRENWEALFARNGKGRAYGAEFMASRNEGNPTGWISYTLARSERKFDKINQGLIFPDQFDVRHSINVAMMLKIDEDADLSLAWVFNSGYRLTLPVSKYYIPVEVGDYTYMNEMYIYSNRNEFKTKPYHRLDISFNFHKQKKRYLRTFTLGIINLYNQRNPNAFYFTEIENFGPNNTRYKRITLMQRSFFPFMPNIGWSWKF